jgi:hypothetical protein
VEIEPAPAPRGIIERLLHRSEIREAAGQIVFRRSRRWRIGSRAGPRFLPAFTMIKHVWLNPHSWADRPEAAVQPPL